MNSGVNPIGVSKRLKEQFGASITCLALTGNWRKQIFYSIATDQNSVFFLNSFSTLRWLTEEINNSTLDYSKCGRGLNKAFKPAYLKSLGQLANNVSLPWPWTVFILYKGKQICRGSLISDEWILTAAWCVTTNKGALTPEDIGLEIGALGQVTEAQSIIYHPLYKPSTSENNVALIRLKNLVTFHDFLRPVCLPLSVEGNSLYELGEVGYVSTWSKTSEGKHRLIDVSLEFAERKHCLEMELGLNNTQMCNTFCTGAGNHNLTYVNGDFGGPLIQYHLDWEGQPVWTQVGVTSFQRLPLYTYFTDVYKTSNWIRSFVEL